MLNYTNLTNGDGVYVRRYTSKMNFTSITIPPPACLGSVLATGADGVVVVLVVTVCLLSFDFLCQKFLSR